jgi:hypothetical protein
MEHLFSDGQLSPSSLVIIGVLAVVLVARNLRPRRLKIDRLWLWPAIYVVLLVSALADSQMELSPLNISLQLGAFVRGALIGWQRARFVEIRIHPETQDLSSRASPIGVLFIFAILVLRVAARGWLASHAADIHIPVVAIGTAFLVLAVAMLIAQRLEIWRRASRMLAEARAAGGPPPPSSLVS